MSQEITIFGLTNDSVMKTTNGEWALVCSLFSLCIKKLILGVLLLAGALSAGAQTQVVAHRGYWKTEGSAQNSITSLQKAQEIGCWGSEFDVHLTRDDVVVVNHDPAIGCVPIQTSRYAKIKNKKLSNGERISTLDQYLEQGAKDSRCKLVLEMKPHASAQREDRLIELCLESIKAHGLYDPSRMVFISFSFYICEQLARLAPGFTVQYLEGNKTPAEVHAAGVNGIDYNQVSYKKHPQWVKEAHDLGMSVNVWTVNDPAVMQEMIDLGVDQITTNEPLTLQQLLMTKL